MKEKLIELLAERGIEAQMGVTPVKYAYVLQVGDGAEAKAFWYLESEGDIDGEITNFIKWNVSEYVFACVKREDYAGGRYMIGEIETLKDYGDPNGIHEDESFMTMSFDELVKALA